jgi:hypothetical protein
MHCRTLDDLFIMNDMTTPPAMSTCASTPGSLAELAPKPAAAAAAPPEEARMDVGLEGPSELRTGAAKTPPTAGTERGVRSALA